MMQMILKPNINIKKTYPSRVANKLYFFPPLQKTVKPLLQAAGDKSVSET